MVKLTRIYTKGGDKGKTSLGRGERVAKHDARVEAYGTVDEANSVIGLARAAIGGGDLLEIEPLEHLDEHEHRVRHRQRDPLLRAPRQHLRQVPPVDELHRDVELLVHAPEVQDLHDVRVDQGRRGAGLVLKSLHVVDVAGERDSQHLQRHLTP